MIAKNNSYFDEELRVNGHYIITGYTNDQFCNNMLQLTDVKYELHHYLRYNQKFDAVFFLDGVNMLYCYDQNSWNILRGTDVNNVTGEVHRYGFESIVAMGPLGHRRRNRSMPQHMSAKTDMGYDITSPFHMGRQSIRVSWEQVTSILRRSENACALVLSNVDSLIDSFDNQAMSILEELQSFHSTGRGVVIYMFRETSVASLFESVNSSSGGIYWSRFVRNILIPRIDSKIPENNRVISVRTPNSNEILNLLNMMRLREEGKLIVDIGDMKEISEILASSCARQKWGLQNLYTRLERCISEQPKRQLSKDNWRDFSGETNYVDPIERLEQLVGMDEVKKDIREWYSQQKLKPQKKETGNLKNYSRFVPLAGSGVVKGHSLNRLIKGNPGTGKTTLARLMGELYYELGLLSQGQLVECSASDLVTENVGGTSGVVRSKVQEAMGGVLFIDEAYALADNSHGHEAITQLVNDLSAYEGQFAVVLAGYPKDMERFMQENDGLARRFPVEYNIPNYTSTQMKEIFVEMVENDPEVRLSDELENVLDNFFEVWVGGNGKARGWGNAGEAKTLLTAMKNRCSARLFVENEFSSVEVKDLKPIDIPENLQHCLAPRSQNLSMAFEEIDKMIGLKNVKKFLRELSRNILWGVEDKAPGNYIFSGAPGTGKTTVARKMGEILGHLGVLERKVNNVVECKAADLLNGRVILSDKVEEARGGILFIDEAHQLEQSDRGRSIITELVPLIEDPQIHADTCFICAGYSAEMRRFLDVDPGLLRRFPINHRIRFEDYTADELTQILKMMASERGEITNSPEFEGYLRRSKATFEKYLEHKPSNFGNGGFIRDVYLPESISARTERLNVSVLGDPEGIISKEQVEEISMSERRTLTEEDIPKSFRHLAGPVGRVYKDNERAAKVLLSELYGKSDIVAYAESLYTNDDELFFEEVPSVGLHYAISGAVGTGKHTAIRAIASVYKELGVLESDNIMFVGKADLEAGFVGQTSIKTQDVIEQAIGGTLVVNSPSSLLPKNAMDNTFGPQALGVILGAMSSHFDDLCVVFIDTTDGMEDVFKVFPSARSQLNRQFVFDDLSPDDMLKIFELKTEDNMDFEDDIKTFLPDFFLNWVSERGGLGENSGSWGNGREVDQLINELRQNWKRHDGNTTSTQISDGEAGYQLTRRFITMDMFPNSLLKYFSSSRVDSEGALEKLESLTGLDGVKKSIRAIERRLRRIHAGTVNPGLYCYIGNPGVGKTTVAKLMGGILKARHTLTQGHVIIRTARQMCDNIDDFDNIIKLAKNGVLFIDEAHQLAEPTNVYGRSVIKRLLTVLEDEDVIKNTCIILAGYPREMKELLATDSGLSSRFGTANSIIEFKDYTYQELVEILKLMAANAMNIVQIGTPFPLRLCDEYVNCVSDIFRNVTSKGNPNFGNARFVRNFLHDSVDELLERIDVEYGVDGEPPEDVSDLLTINDIPKQYRSMVHKINYSENV